MIAENASFQETVGAFQEFLEKCGHSKKIAWVGPEDVLLTGKRFIYVRLPLAESGAERARQSYDEGMKQGRGVRLETLFQLGEITCCHVWVPKDDLDAEYAMMGRGPKLSVRTDEIVGKPVRVNLHWMWLRWWYRRKQKQKEWIFHSG